MNSIEIGKFGEKAAVEYLREHGYKILHTNYRCSLGELDIVALDKDTLVFIEVKSRSSDFFGYPQEGVTKKKQSKIIKLAQVYIKQNQKAGYKCRFDVVSVLLNRHNMNIKSIDLITDAF